MDLYQKNLNFLKENLPSIYNSLQSDESQFESHISAIDTPNLKVEYDAKACYIHSLYNTDRETAEMFSKVDPNIATIAIFGMGLWHCYDYLISNFKKLKRIIVIEPDLNLFKSILNVIDIGSLKTKCDITFIVNRQKDDVTDAIWNLLSLNITMGFEFVFNLSYRSLYLDYYHYIYQGVTSKIKKCLINISTESAFAYQWAENTIRNYRHNALPLTKMIGHFTGLPIIIVSAGPSLNYNIQYLKEAKNKAVVLAVGSAIKILDSNGIVPHFRMALDPQESEIDIFNNIDTEAASLIFSDRLYHGVLDQYKGNKIRMLLDTDYTSQYVYPKLYQEGFTIASGFSVANVALDVAIKLGFTKIVFIGQDLCYTEGSLYAKGGWTEETIDENNERYIKNTNCLGETVYTDRPFLGMKYLFETTIRLNPNRTYINATERGLDILGTFNKSINKVIEEDLSEAVDIDQLIENIINQNQEEGLAWKQKLAQLNLNDYIKELNDLNELRLNQLKKLKKYLGRGIGINKLQSELKYIDDNFTLQINDNEFYKIAVRPTLNVILYAVILKHQYDGQDEFKIIENRVNSLLGEVTVLKQYLDVLQDIISKLEDISE